MGAPAPGLVSVVMPCHNAAAHLRDSAGSALGQSDPDLEVVVVDDGSTDGSREILEDLRRRDPRLRVVAQPNRGAGAARNRGLAEARGDHIAFLDSDDYWEAGFVARLREALAASGAGLAYCGWQNVGLSGGRGRPFVPPDYEGADLPELLLGGNRWPIHAALTRRREIDRIGGFDERLSSCMDYDLWLRMSTSVRLVRVPEVLAYYRHHGGIQITKDRARGAINHWTSQRRFLDAHPEVAARLGSDRVRELTYGELLRRGYGAYWARDLAAARRIFRQVMRGRYGSGHDWRYMLPSLLPMPVHRAVIERVDRRREGRV